MAAEIQCEALELDILNQIKNLDVEFVDENIGGIKVENYFIAANLKSQDGFLFFLNTKFSDYPTCILIVNDIRKQMYQISLKANKKLFQGKGSIFPCILYLDSQKSLNIKLYDVIYLDGKHMLKYEYSSRYEKIVEALHKHVFCYHHKLATKKVRLTSAKIYDRSYIHPRAIAFPARIYFLNNRKKKFEKKISENINSL